MNTNYYFNILVLLILVELVNSFRLGFQKQSKLNVLKATTPPINHDDKPVWSGERPPLPKPEFMSQKMDASWGRGKYRSEVWDDDVNPVNFWWTAYAPSEEEVAAAAAGYDFKNPKEWFDVRNHIFFNKNSYLLFNKNNRHIIYFIFRLEELMEQKQWKMLGKLRKNKLLHI